MPSPVGHSLSGILGYLLIGGRGRKTFWLLSGFILVTNLPDFDFFPGWLIGEPNLFHRGASHSLFMSLVVGAIVGGVVRLSGRGRSLRAALACSALYALHIVLDLFSVDYSTPRGFQLLWPLSERHYIAPIGLFLNITRSAAAEDFLPSLFNTHNLEAVINEIVIFLPAILLLWGLRGEMLAHRVPVGQARAFGARGRSGCEGPVLRPRS